MSKQRKHGKPGYYRAGPNRGLPISCECGGKMEYDHQFGRVFSACNRCTPVAVVKVSNGKVIK